MKAGDVVSNVEFLKVVAARQDSIDVENLHTGLVSRINGDKLIEELKSADDYKTTKKVTKTALAEQLMASYNVALTVCFDKSNGTERVLRGRLMSHEPLMGRSYCEDFDIAGTPKDRLRQVDHRTLKWLVVNGTKYEVK